MNKHVDPNILTKWQEQIEAATVSDWIQEMHRHYRATGSYRPEDLRRLLGDPNQGVEIGPESSLASALSQKKASV